MTIISFIALIIGGLNWLSIGLLQYDFVAGLFGTQASIFSRIIYICVGIGTSIILFNLAKNKGRLHLLSHKQKNQFESQTQNNLGNHNPSNHIERDILGD